MNFKVNINRNIPKKQKNRNFLKFNFFNDFYKYSTIIALQKYKLYINHLKLINLFLNKKSIKFSKKTKKDQFKKITDINLRKLSFNKDNFILKNLMNLKESKLKKKYFKKFKKKKSFTFFNLPFLSFTKKSIGSRMGKGKGSVNNWYIQIYSGYNILFFINWDNNLMKYILKFLIKILPNKNKYILSDFKCFFTINYMLIIKLKKINIIFF